jgi:hypothetical protein
MELNDAIKGEKQRSFERTGPAVSDEVREA